MTLYYIDNNNVKKWLGEPMPNSEGNFVHLPLSVENQLSNDVLNSFGLYRESQIVRPEIPEGKIIASRTMIVLDGVITYQYSFVDAPTPEELLEQEKPSVLSQINTKFYEVMEGGYQHNFGTEEEPIYGVLQTRKGSDDATNWLSLKDTCNEYMAGGGGSLPCDPPIKTADNVQHIQTYAEVAETLNALKSWGAYNLKMSWALKDLVVAATNDTELQSVKDQIEAGITDESKDLNGWPTHVVIE